MSQSQFNTSNKDFTVKHKFIVARTKIRIQGQGQSEIKTIHKENIYQKLKQLTSAIQYFSSINLGTMIIIGIPNNYSAMKTKLSVSNIIVRVHLYDYFNL